MVLSRRLRSDGDRRAEDRWNDVPFRRGTCGYGRSYASVKRNLKDPWNHTHWWVLSEFWVFQEKVDMKVSAFSFTTSLLVFGYL